MSDFRTSREASANWIWIIGFAALAVFVRIVPYLFKLEPTAAYVWNMTPVGALALFSGARLGSRAAFLVPALVMLVSDLLLLVPLGSAAFNWTTPIIYASFMLNVAIGRLFWKTSSPLWAVPGACMTTTQFFLITNFVHWLSVDGANFARSFAGLMDCYVAALPFCKGTLIGDLSYSLVFFGLYAAVQFVTQRQKVSQPA